MISSRTRTSPPKKAILARSRPPIPNTPSSPRKAGTSTDQPRLLLVDLWTAPSIMPISFPFFLPSIAFALTTRCAPGWCQSSQWGVFSGADRSGRFLNGEPTESVEKDGCREPAVHRFSV